MTLVASQSLRGRLTHSLLGWPRLSPLARRSAFLPRSPFVVVVAANTNAYAYTGTPTTTTTTTTTTSAMGELRSFSTVNFYSGSELNRLSWLRDDDAFLNRAITSPQAQFVLINRSRPMVFQGGEKDCRLATLSWEQVAPHLGWTQQKGVFGAQANDFTTPTTEEEQIKLQKATAGLVPEGIVLVLLGMKESDEMALPGREPHGIPYFALSLSYVPPGVKEGQELVARLRQQLENNDQYKFGDTRAIATMGTWPKGEAAMVAQANSLIDWNERNQFCPASGRRQYSLWAGYKRTCTSSIESFDAPMVRNLMNFAPGYRTPCPSNNSIQNFNYPRTDPVTIMAAISPDGDHILLGRKKNWPAGFYSCLAGFVEPGESVEDAVRREIQEEAGVRVSDVYYHSSQPWPFPANMMLGAFALAYPDSQIRLDLDNELEDARWFTRDEILRILQGTQEDTLTTKELEQMHDEGAHVECSDGVPIRVPGATAIAHTLIAAWARKEAIIPGSIKQKI